MKRIATSVAFALMLAPVLAHAEEKATTRTTSKDTDRNAANPMNTPDTDGKMNKAKSGEEKMTDARLVTLLQQIDKDEIDAGKLAEKNGKSAEIKNFGKKLIADHTKSQKDVAAAAKQAGISPSDSALTAHDREMMKVDKNKMDQLKKMSGAEFDKAFATEMSNDHKHVIGMLKDAKGDLKSDQLKTLVDNTIPVLEQHKDMAEDAASKADHASAGSNQGRAPRSLDRSTDTGSTSGTKAKSDTGSDSTSKSDPKSAPAPDKR